MGFRFGLGLGFGLGVGVGGSKGWVRLRLRLGFGSVARTLGVLAFLVIFVIPSLVGDILENQADPAAAIAKKQQKLKDLEDKYSFLVGDAPAPAPAADEPPADEFTQRKAEADAAASDEADALLASVKAMTNKD